MRLLIDTHLLLWAAQGSARLPQSARLMIEDPVNTPMFSAASLWEIAIKTGLGRSDFKVDPRLLLSGLLDNGYRELPIRSEHATMLDQLAPLHKDPFDRLLVAQANAEGILLLTSDPIVARYPGLIRLV